MLMNVHMFELLHIPTVVLMGGQTQLSGVILHCIDSKDQAQVFRLNVKHPYPKSQPSH